MTTVQIKELQNRIRDPKNRKEIDDIASEITCTMCGKKFNWMDVNLGDNLYDIFVGYGSRHDGERMQFSFCCDCFDKVIDWIIPQCKLDPIVDSDYFDHCIGADNHIHEDWGFGGVNQHKDKTRLVVCGGKDFSDYEYMSGVLDEYLQGVTNAEIVSGHEKGADTLGERYANEHGIPCSLFPEDCANYGKFADYILNSRMIDYVMGAKPLVIAFWDGKSHGTKNTLKKAFLKNIPCVIAGYQGYDINGMIRRVDQKDAMQAAYVLGFYNGFHGLPLPWDIRKEWEQEYLRGYQDAKSAEDNRHLAEFGYRSIAELKLEDAKAVMICDNPQFDWIERIDF